MPPKRLNKRRQDDEGSSSRPQKKGAKGRKEPTYDTYDDALDGGVDMEEKGERYRDGDKAQRFYERALELYKKAYDFNPTYDAAYNQARVLFTLATSFFLPPTSVSYLTTSIELYRHTITLTESTILQLDTGFNLAQALLELAEVLEDLHPERKDQVRLVREEARDILDRVMLGQEEYINSTAEEMEMDQASEAVEEKEPQEGEQVMAEDDENTDDAGPATFEQHVPTPTSFIDTALLLVDTHLTLWTSAVPSAPPTAEQQTAVRSILDRSGVLVPGGRQAELDFAEIKVLLAMDEIVWEAFKVEAKVGTGIEKSLEGAVGALTSLLASLDTYPPDEPTLRADILTTLAETHSTMAYRLLHLTPQLPAGPSPLAQGAWFNLSQAVTQLGKAVDLPSNPDAPKTFKPHVLLQLSRASLSRAKLHQINDTAKRNLTQLLDNSMTYATRAADMIGWGGLVKGSMGFVPPHPAGWDAEWLARSILLQMIRVDYVTQECGLGDKYSQTTEGLKKRLAGLPMDRRPTGSDFERWASDLIDEEEGMSDAEREFWKQSTLAATNQS